MTTFTDAKQRDLKAVVGSGGPERGKDAHCKGASRAEAQGGVGQKHLYGRMISVRRKVNRGRGVSSESYAGCW
jgi:hypothetical protein